MTTEQVLAPNVITPALAAPVVAETEHPKTVNFVPIASNAVAAALFAGGVAGLEPPPTVTPPLPNQLIDGLNPLIPSPP
jgi:hypothetical protein